MNRGPEIRDYAQASAEPSGEKLGLNRLHGEDANAGEVDRYRKRGAAVRGVAAPSPRFKHPRSTDDPVVRISYPAPPFKGARRLEGVFSSRYLQDGT